MDELVVVEDAKKPRSIQDRIEAPEKLAGGVLIGVSIMDAFGQADDAAPAWGSPILRAAHLDKVWRDDSRLSGVVFTMNSRVGAAGWSISGPVKELPVWYDLFALADGDWTDFIRLGYLNYLATDEGFCMETARESYPDGLVQKIWHMDSARVVPGPVRVGSKVYPLVFQDVDKWKTLKEGQFYRMCSLPSTDQWKRRLGYCFMSRILRYAKWGAGILEYQEEKLENLPPEGVATVTGLTKTQVENAFREYEQARQQKRSYTFPGLLWFISNTFGQKAEVDWTSFRDVWEGFDDRTVNEVFMKVVSLDAGVDVGEFWQVEFHGATKAASWLQHTKSWGKGPAEFIAGFERWATRTLPFGFNFMFDAPDDEQDLLQARIHTLGIKNVKELASPLTKEDPEGLITREEAREMLAEQGIIPQRFVLPPERVATDVLRSMTGRDVGTMRWPDGHIEWHHKYWELNSGMFTAPTFKTLPEGVDLAMLLAIKKNWDILTTVFSTLLSRWAADVRQVMRDRPEVLDDDVYWRSWADEIERVVYDDYVGVALDSMDATGLTVSFERENEIALEVAEEQAFDLVQLDGPTSIVRTTRDKLLRVKERLASGELAFADLESALAPTFSPARARMIAVTENTAIWAEAQMRSAKDAGMAEKRSVRADYDRPCPSGICAEAEAVGWVPLDAEIVPGYTQPPYHPGGFCYLSFR